MTRLVLLAVAIGATACGAASQRPVEALGDTVRTYHDGIRWERFEIAASSLPPRERSRAIDDWDQRASDLKISDYEVVKLDARGKEAKVQIKLSWYRASEGTLHETQTMETWERHGQAWYLVDEARLRGAEMPGLPEPVKKDAVPKDTNWDADEKPAKSASARAPGSR